MLSLLIASSYASQSSYPPLSYHFDRSAAVVLVEPTVGEDAVEGWEWVTVGRTFKGSSLDGQRWLVPGAAHRSLVFLEEGDGGLVAELQARRWAHHSPLLTEVPRHITLEELLETRLPVLAAQQRDMDQGRRPAHLTRGPVPEVDPGEARVAGKLVPEGCACGNRYPVSIAIDLAEVIVRGTVHAERGVVEVAEVLKGDLAERTEVRVRLLDPSNAACEWWTEAAGKEALLFAGRAVDQLELGSCHLVLPSDGVSKPDLNLYPDVRSEFPYDEALPMVRKLIAVQASLGDGFWEQVRYRATGIVAGPALLEP